MILAARDVATGRITPGHFVLIQSLFLQLSGPLWNVGTVLREMDQATVEAEDLYNLMRSKPDVIEKEDAEEFEFKEGRLQFDDVTFSY